MIAYHEGLVPYAQAAKIEVPPDPRNYRPRSYIRWHLLVWFQLGRPIPEGASIGETVRANADIIARLTLVEAETASRKSLEEKGCR